MTIQQLVDFRAALTPSNIRAILAEFFATFFFVLIGAGAVISLVSLDGDLTATVVGIALAHGLAIALLVAATVHISGGHINPAVTFGMVVTGRMKIDLGILYVAAQLVGAVLAALALKVIFAGALEGNLGAHGLGDAAANAGAGVLVEALLTFLLVGVVFATAVHPQGLRSLAPIAIGLAVLVDHLIGVPLTGASMNPARSFGPALIANSWADHWIYWIGPLLGGGAAALVYQYVFAPKGQGN